MNYIIADAPPNVKTKIVNKRLKPGKVGGAAYFLIDRGNWMYYHPIRKMYLQLSLDRVQAPGKGTLSILKGGIRKSNQAEKYVFGYRLFDKVQFNEQDCFIWGRRTTGIFTIKTINGKMIKDGISFKKLKFVEKSTSYLIA